jgi:hypothetical protein
MALLTEQKQAYGIIKGYNDKPEEPAADATATEITAFKDRMNHRGVFRSTVLLGIVRPSLSTERHHVAGG